MVHSKALAAALGIVAVGCAVTAASAAVETFGETDSPPAGTVIFGEEPGGGSASGIFFPGFTVSGENNDDLSPDSIIIFDSNNPTGNDADLGSPNRRCPGGGPGDGAGGWPGTPGENCEDLDNLLIIPEDITDTDGDGLVDDPSDDVFGGRIVIEFDEVSIVDYVTLVDIDSESATISLLDAGTLLVDVDATDLGNNSKQDISLAAWDSGITTIIVNFSSSGGLARVSWDALPVPTQDTSWSSVKSVYRR